MSRTDSSAVSRAACASLAGLGVLSAAPGAAWGHAIVQRYDLPVPLGYYLAGAGLVVALTFVVLAAFRRDAAPVPPRSLDLSRTWLGRLVASDVPARMLAILAVVVFVFLIVAGLLGTQEDPLANILPAFVWIAWWVGLGFVCALVGNIWPAVNPWAAVPALLPGSLRRGAVRRAPSWIGVWPAVFLYLCFAWAELVWPDNTAPASLASVILIYSAITWTGMARYGVEPWLKCGETFSVVFGLFGRFAPLTRTAEGRLLLRHYGSGLADGRKAPISMVVLVVTLLATVSFDGFLHTPVWARLYAAASHGLYDLGWTHFLGNTGARTLVFTTGLVLAPLCFVALFLGTCKLMAHLERGPGDLRRSATDVASSYFLTLMPIAIAYHLAHYLLLLMIEGQRLYGHVSDPFGIGWDLFGTAGMTPDPTVVDARSLWLFSLFVIVAGHVIAVWLTHLAAHRGHGGKAMVAAQLPMLVLMVGYTVFSLWIIGQPIVEV